MPNCNRCNDTKKIPLFLPGSFAECDWCAEPKASAPEEPEEDDLDEEDEEDPVLFTINGDEVRSIRRVYKMDGGGAEVQTDMGDYVVFPDSETAGEAAREYWEHMAQSDADEFTLMVGKETLVAWALGNAAGPGTARVASLSDWLDLWLDTPEEHFASYDGHECDVDDVHEDAEDEIGFKPGVAYKR